jgi:amino acid transporter
MGERKFAFTRPSSGLVRQLTPVHATFLNASVVLNAITNTLPGYMIVATISFPQANILLAGLIAVFMGVTLIVAYGLMTSAMPRSSGDYVWVSRVLHPLLGVVVGFLFWVFFWGWLSYNGWVFAHVGLAAPLQTYGYLAGNNALVSLGQAIGSDTGSFLFGLIMIFLPFLVVIFGIKRVGQAAVVCGIATLLGALALLFNILSINQAVFVSRFDTVLGSGAYRNFIETARAAGWSGTTAFTGGINLFDTLVLAAIFGSGFTLWCWAHIPLVGELKNAQSVNKNIVMMTIPLFSAGTIVTLYYYIFNSVVGELNTAIFYLGNAGNPLVETLPFAWNTSTVYLPMLAVGPMMLPLVIFFVALSACSAALYANILNIVAPVRYMFAQAFDGVLPRALSSIWERHHVPLVGYVVLAVGAVIWHILQTIYPGFWYYLSFVIGGQVLMWIFGCLAAAIFPYRLKSVFEASPAGRYKVAGVPVITIFGVLGCLSMLVYLGVNLGVSELGGTTNVPTLVVMGIVAVIIYFVAKAYRSSKEGIDIGLAFKEIPPE